MIHLLELKLTLSRSSTTSASASNDTVPFHFPFGRSAHEAFLVKDEPIISVHQPLFFYLGIWASSALGNLALWMRGFRYYGPLRLMVRLFSVDDWSLWTDDDLLWLEFSGPFPSFS